MDISLLSNEASRGMLPPKRKRPSAGVAGDLPWTEARCNRLLRTITSRISILRKVSKSFRSNDPACRVEKPPGSAKHDATRQKADDEPEWMPGGLKQSGIRPTYGGKAKLSQPKPSPSRAVFSTPFVRRALGGAKTPGSVDPEGKTKNHAANQSYRRKMGLPVKPTDSAEEAEAKLIAALDVLLVQTASPKEEPRVGVRSLTGTCLRKVPAFIDLVHDFNKEDYGDEADDPTSSIYTQLEQLGTRQGGGWRGLREVVRAHAVYRLAQAIEEGLISDATCDALISRCGRSSSGLPEASRLFLAWSQRTASKRSSQVLVMSGRLFQSLDDLTKLNKSPELLLQLQARLISTGVFNPLSLGSAGPSIWRHVLACLMRESTFFVAAEFFKTVVQALLELPVASRSSILPSFARSIQGILSLTTGIFIARGAPSDYSRIGATKNMLQLSRELILLITGSGLDLAAAGPTYRSLMLPFFHSNLLLECLACGNEELDHDCWSSLMMDIEHTHGCPITKVQTSDGFALEIEHIRHVVSSIRVVDTESALVVLQRIVTSMLSAAKRNRGSTESAVLNRLALDTAFEEANLTGTKDSRELAEYIETQLRGSPRAPREGAPATPRAITTSAAFKWDEGLCEWLAQTPFSNLQRQPVDKNEPPISRFGMVVRQDKPAHTQNQQLLVQQSPDVLTEQSPNILRQPVDESPIQSRKVKSLFPPPAPRSSTPSSPIEPANPNTRAKKPTKVLPTHQPALKPLQPLNPNPLPPQLSKPEPIPFRREHLKLKRSTSATDLIAPVQKPKRRKTERHSTSSSQSTAFSSSSSASVLVRAEVEADELGLATPARVGPRGLGGGKEGKGRGVLAGGRGSVGKRDAGVVEVGSEDELGM